MTPNPGPSLGQCADAGEGQDSGDRTTPIG